MSETIYTAKAHVTGGRSEGHGTSDDGRLDVAITPPTEDGPGTNPEQLFAVGYAACFLSALKLVASKRGENADDATIDSSVDLVRDGRAFTVAVTLDLNWPSADPEMAQKFLEIAHEVCPYSNATRGNIDVTLSLAGTPVTA